MTPSGLLQAVSTALCGRPCPGMLSSCAHLLVREPRGFPPFRRRGKADFIMHAGNGIIRKAMRLDFRHGGLRPSQA